MVAISRRQCYPPAQQGLLAALWFLKSLDFDRIKDASLIVRLSYKPVQCVEAALTKGVIALVLTVQLCPHRRSDRHLLILIMLERRDMPSRRVI
jgi:hypothetical protein